LKAARPTKKVAPIRGTINWDG